VQNYTRIHSLNQGSVPEQEVKKQELLVETARTDLAAADIALKQAQAAEVSGVKEGQAQLKALEATLERARLEVPLETARRSVELARARLEASVVRAPADGVVLAIVTRAGEITGPRPLLRMGDTERLAVVAEVDESDILKVREKQPARVSSPVFQQLKIERIHGQVVSIAATVSRNGVTDLNPAALADRRVTDVKILLDFQDVGDEVRKRLARLINLQVNVDILLPLPGEQ
jgi:ABC exporter DevB family membrane fusion protein